MPKAHSIGRSARDADVFDLHYKLCFCWCNIIVWAQEEFSFAKYFCSFVDVLL